MINDIASSPQISAISPSLALPVGAPLGDFARSVAAIDGALGPSVKGLSESLVSALGQVGDRVGSAQLEGAMLDFAREAKAFAIGNPDLPATDRDACITSAIDAGVAKSNALPDVGLSPLDHAVTIFAEAAQSLATTSAAPLYDSSPR
jgi:hypothetical protein